MELQMDFLWEWIDNLQYGEQGWQAVCDQAIA